MVERWYWSAHFQRFGTCEWLMCPRFLPCWLSDGVTGVLWGPLQPHHSLGPTHLLQLGAQTALQEQLLLLSSAHVQAEGGEAALHRWETDHSHLQIHPHLQLWRVQLNSKQQQHLEPSAETQFGWFLSNTDSSSRSLYEWFYSYRCFHQLNTPCTPSKWRR